MNDGERISEIIDSASNYLIAPKLTWPVAEHLIHRVAERYSEPWRFYHVVSHLGDVTKFLVENAGDLHSPRTILWAAMYHDAVYIPQTPPGVNEELSAQLSEAELARYLPEDEVTAVGSYVRRTSEHHPDSEVTDLSYLLDSDLLILGAPEEEFETYDVNIRREYSFVDLAAYKTARARILKNFFDRQYIFMTEAAREEYEEQARANLERKLNELGSSLL